MCSVFGGLCSAGRDRMWRSSLVGVTARLIEISVWVCMKAGNEYNYAYIVMKWFYGNDGGAYICYRRVINTRSK